MNSTAKFYAFRNLTELKDEELIEMIKAGDEEAFKGKKETKQLL